MAPSKVRATTVAGLRKTVVAMLSPECTGPAADQQDVVADAQGGRMDPPQGEPDVTLTAEAGVLALLVWGRVGVRQVVTDGRLMVSGDQVKADEFIGWLSAK